MTRHSSPEVDHLVENIIKSVGDVSFSTKFRHPHCGLCTGTSADPKGLETSDIIFGINEFVL